MSDTKSGPGRPPAAQALKKSLTELEGTVKVLTESVATVKSALAELDSRFSRLEVSAPPTLRALDASSVRQIVAADPYAEFEVLESWKHGSRKFTAGDTVRADHVPRVIDFIKTGLKLGVPDRDREAAIAQYAKEARARAALHREEVLAKAQADADAAQLKVAAMGATKS